MNNSVLFDYTTIVSANNVLNCQKSFYPLTTTNPYINLLSGEKTEKDSPLWLEVASLADVVEAAVIHDQLCLAKILPSDRVFDTGRYQTKDSQTEFFFSELQKEKALSFIDLSAEHSHALLDWVRSASQSEEFVDTILTSFFSILQQPVYKSIPDLFSHSQTIYKFDGESMWELFKQSLTMSKFSRQYQRKKITQSFTPSLNYTEFFYAEDIVAFLIRGLLYNQMAILERIPYHPHPARSLITMTDGLWALNIAEYAKIPIEYVMNLRSEVAKQTNEKLRNNLFEINSPPVFSVVLRESNKPQDIPLVTMQIRNSKSAKAFRQWMGSIYDTNSGLKLVELQKELDLIRKGFMLELGLEQQQIDLSIWIFGFPIKIPPWAQKAITFEPRYHLQFLRELARTSLDVIDSEKDLIRIFSK